MQRISFTYKGKPLKGLLVQEQEGQLTIKLDTGYNIIVARSDLTSVLETEFEKKEMPTGKIKQHNNLPPVTILHTGGTIASKVDYATGAVNAQFEPSELLSMFPELTTVAQIESKLIRNMQSDDMRFAHYNIMARAILDEIVRGAEGIIVTHGTDTLHYTGAALAFALQGLNIPVVLVGSQRSSDRGSSDAASNLLGALRFIIQTKAPGVYIAMHEGPGDDSILILDGLHARKNHSSRRDAFVPVNGLAVARVQDGKVETIDAARIERYTTAASPRPEVISFNEELKVGLWKAHPQSYVDELVGFEEFDGLVIEGTGMGHAPISEIDEFTKEHLLLCERIEYLARKMPVVMSTQTIFGRVNMNVYSPGRTLLGFGVLGQGCDMPAEVAFIKLAWLLSHEKPEVVRQKFNIDVRGEISTRSELEDAHNSE